MPVIGGKNTCFGFQGNMPKMVDMITPKIVVTYADLRLEEMKMPGVEIITLQPGEIYSYPHSAFAP